MATKTAPDEVGTPAAAARSLSEVWGNVEGVPSDTTEAPAVPSSHPPLPTTPDQTAGLLLVARRWKETYGLPRSSVEQILAATGASRESALEIEAALVAELEALEPSLRPGDRAPEVDDRGRIHALLHEALCFVMQNPACTRRTPRGRHAASYRQFVIELRARYADVSASAFADALDVPVSTLDAWMRSRHGVAARVAHAVQVAFARAQTTTSLP